MAENLETGSINYLDMIEKDPFCFSFHLIFRVFVYVYVSLMHICSSNSYLDFYLSTNSASLRQLSEISSLYFLISAGL